ncbi:ABC transporter permease [Cognatishimia maritima]|uniref:Peptide/nickel transport system permease protein n=1 Tax=Cognatishimia maritima TaxID=870908 RepID=A0A1M5QNA9_9RHOB|nr:ABC transporter permease [Cognatishimia maritima]SHH15371.1 peptide/nickel transport system permease protein [Cognatishimia maritima]
MIAYLARRLIAMILTLLILSMVVFVVIQLPPGDFVTSYIARLSSMGEVPDENVVEAIRAQYKLDDPLFVQYWAWLEGMFTGNFGFSFEMKRPVAEIFSQRIGISLTVEILAIVVMWGIAIPIGIYSAVYQYSVGDYVATIVGFLGIAVPNFLFALILMYVCYVWFGVTITGLNSPDFANERWSLAKLLDFASHVWAPVLVIATGGAATLIRVLRANLLDELKKPYVLTARAKGLKRHKVIMRYPVRVAMNPLISVVGWVLPTVISSSFVTAIVLNMPTLSPILLRALLSQDMYLAGALILFMGFLTMIGTLLSDILLAWIDPRIRMGMIGAR